ncbi:DUF6612 family protein [Paenibacillus hodogayensis]|uniref:DUF6612 family protein n=1 Tax=Paenibacillus hodogayensis TaxID=279208 RepID=A0ABV5W2I4_9BACL
MKKMYKKWTKTATTTLLAASIALLGACGQKPEEPTSAAPPVTANEKEAGAKTETSTSKPEAPKTTGASDVFAKTLEASAKLESYAVSMNSKQNIDQNGTKMDIVSKIDMDIVMKPQMSFKQVMSMNSAGQDMKMESYFTKDGFVMKDPTSGQWMKLPKEQMDLVLSQMSEEQLDPAKQMEKLKQFANDFTMTESGGDYKVTLLANGDKFNDFIKSELKGLGDQGALGGAVGDSMAGMKVTKMEYTFTVDKKTYNPKAILMNMDLEMDVQGQKVRMSQQMDGTYSNYNGIKEIVVPKEAMEAKTLGAA